MTTPRDDEPLVKACNRDPKRGPGSCDQYWHNCPAEIPDCHLRRLRDDFERECG